MNDSRNNNTYLPLNSNNIKPLIHKPHLQPSLHPVKAQEEHSNNCTITETTAAAKDSNDPDDSNIGGITCFSSAISDTSLSNVIFTPEANETSTSEEISMFSQLPSKDKHIVTKDNPSNNIAFKEHSKQKQKKRKV